MESEFNVYVLGDHKPTPGPGAYKIKSTIGSGPQSTISPRYSTKSYKSEGGLVAVPSTFGSGPKISMGYRPHEPKKHETPGPGYVPPPLGSNSPRISFPKAKPKRQSAKAKVMPGPGQYQPKNNEFGSNAKMGSFPHSPRNTVFNKKEDNKPVYAPKYNGVMKSSPRYSIGHKTNERASISEGPNFAPPGTTLAGVKTEFPHAGRQQVTH